MNMSAHSSSSSSSTIASAAVASSLKIVQSEYSPSESALQRLVKAMPLPLPKVLEDARNITFASHEALGAFGDHEDIQRSFPATYGRARISVELASNSSNSSSYSSSSSDGIGPYCNKKAYLRVGVCLSGGQAPGGHNVIAGVYDFVKKYSKDSVLVGFMDGPHGIFSGRYTILDDKIINHYRNSGGFDIIGSGRHKIESPAHFAAAMANCIELQLDGLVVIGGDDSNTNAAVLAEYFEVNGCKTKVCGCPKTIDGDLKVDPYIPISFGFDSACRTYSELVGNLAQDTLSSQKYYHFVRLMGRAASNIALEVALMTRPNVCLISEEVEADKKTLSQITHDIVRVIVDRQKQGKNYGIILLPEGLIEFIPEFNVLIEQINDILGDPSVSKGDVRDKLNETNRAVFDYLPVLIQEQLLLDRDPHGNVQVTKIETEKLLAQTVEKELAALTEQGEYQGEFSPQFHSYGYEGRSCLPSSFDLTYCYALGQNVAALILMGHNGLISSVTNLTAPVVDWKCGGVPITMMCHMEKRHGHMKPVINKALVELKGEPFTWFKSQRSDWAKYDLYRSPGPIQFFEENHTIELCLTLTLELTKTDSRLDPKILEASKAQQDATRKFGSFLLAPVSGPAVSLYSSLQETRTKFKPDLCPALKAGGGGGVVLGHSSQCRKSKDKADLSGKFPLTYGARMASLQQGPLSTNEGNKSLRVGVVYFGRQAPGGHDVISGLLDALDADSTGKSALYGFVGGSVGLCSNQHVVITADTFSLYRAQGGLDFLCRSADSLKSSSYDKVLSTVTALDLDGLVLVGGCRTATTAGYIAEYLASKGSKCGIFTVPVDISGSFKNEYVETSVGFDTTTKTSAQIVGNNATDGASAKKHYYFMRIMGDEPSHSTLEVALLTKPNCVILSEEVSAKRMSLSDIVNTIADVIQSRWERGKNYGTIVMPEGLVEWIPEIKNLIYEIDSLYKAAAEQISASASKSGKVRRLSISSSDTGAVILTPETVVKNLSLWSKAVLESLPSFMQSALLLSRGSNNTVQLSQVPTERLLAYFVEAEMEYRRSKGAYKGTFATNCCFIGYQSRGALPTNFDVNYAYNLGFATVSLINQGLNGYITTVQNLKGPVSNWTVSAVPILSLFESNHDHTETPGISKTFVDINGPAFASLLEDRKTCSLADMNENPGPVQFFGPQAILDRRSHSLTLESYSYVQEINKVRSSLTAIEEACRPGCSSTLLSIALKNLSALTEIIEVIQKHENK